ncbi:hypothetical protein ABBQ38_000805 [Trebouxia sp. C0009 RCD-2024]
MAGSSQDWQSSLTRPGCVEDANCTSYQRETNPMRLLRSLHLLSKSRRRRARSLQNLLLQKRRHGQPRKETAPNAIAKKKPAFSGFLEGQGHREGCTKQGG